MLACNNSRWHFNHVMNAAGRELPENDLLGIMLTQATQEAFTDDEIVDEVSIFYFVWPITCMYRIIVVLWGSICTLMRYYCE